MQKRFGLGSLKYIYFCNCDKDVWDIVQLGRTTVQCCPADKQPHRSF